VSTNPKDDNSLPNETVNNFYLGNILKTVFEKHYHGPSSENVVASSDRIVISLMGWEFARKHQIYFDYNGIGGIKLLQFTITVYI
jgi:hypothetical protein